MRVYLIILTLIVAACAPISNETEQPAPEMEGEEADQPEIETPAPIQPEIEPAPEEEPLIFTLPHQRCLGHWADNSDSSTRFTAHPDTGLCTFACVWEDPRCDESWFGDPRCFPAHAAVLGELCSELGGTCALDSSASNRYCVAP